MLTRPAHLLSPPEITDPDFPAKCAAWTAQLRAEMDETVVATRRTINESLALIKEANRVLGPK
jgi:hypothetical protein